MGTLIPGKVMDTTSTKSTPTKDIYHYSEADMTGKCTT